GPFLAVWTSKVLVEDGLAAVDQRLDLIGDPTSEAAVGAVLRLGVQRCVPGLALLALLFGLQRPDVDAAGVVVAHCLVDHWLRLGAGLDGAGQLLRCEY